jgi:hypothetical protein
VGPRGRKRHPGLFDELEQGAFGPGEPDAGPRENHRAVRGAQHRHDIGDRRVQQGRVGGSFRRGHAKFEDFAGRLQIARNVEPHRTRPAADGQSMGGGQHVGQIGERAHGPRRLGDRFDHVDDGSLLIPQLAKARHRIEGQSGLAFDLPRQHDHRNRVGEGAEHAVERIDAAGSCRHIEHGGLAADAGIAFGSHRTGLLMMHVGALHAALAGKGVIQEHGAPAGHGEHLIDALRRKPGRDALRRRDGGCRDCRRRRRCGHGGSGLHGFASKNSPILSATKSNMSCLSPG